MPHESMIIDALDALPQQLVVVDAAGRIVKANRAWLEDHGRPPGGYEGRDVLDVYRSDHALAADAARRMRAGFQAVLDRRRRIFSIEYAHLPEGEARPRWYVMTASPVPNGHRGMILSQQDVTEQRRLEAELSEQAHRDPLTGLPNRRLFRMEAERMLSLAERRGWSLALLYLDLDGFKDVNDRLGHEAGDAVLRRIAERLQAEARGGDLLARIGGDEFVVLLDAVRDEATGAETVARLEAACAAPMVIHGHPVRLGASIGVARHPADACKIDELLRLADEAMYRRKAERKRAALPVGVGRGRRPALAGA